MIILLNLLSDNLKLAALSATRANIMELLTKLTRLHSQLIDNNNVFCPKNVAKDFFIYLKMLDINVAYELSGTKILFTIK